MNKQGKSVLTKLVAMMMALIMCVGTLFAQEVSHVKAITVYLIGDSTVCEYGDDSKNYNVERAGWGENISNYFNDNVNFVNLAISGRSARSFTYEAKYQQLLKNIKSGDYVFIQFGHNDQKEDDLTLEDTSKRYRHSSPVGDETVEGSFAYYLYTYYIKVAQEKGAIPVLVTPIVRREFEGGKVKDSHYSVVEGEKAISYDDAMRQLAKKLNVTLIDLNAKTEALYNELGEEVTIGFHALYNSNKGDKVDNTHLNDIGSQKVAGLVAEAIKASHLALKNELKEEVARTTHIYIVGDSTACEYGDDTANYIIERAGWGESLDHYFNHNDVTVVNLALSGRSSRSFTYEKNYETLKKELKAGDYLFIQFGHNDEKTDDTTSSETSKLYRHTSPIGDEKTEGSYQYYLYNYYIKLAEEKGATPVLITPIVRRKFEDGKVKDSHYSVVENEKFMSYDDAMRNLSEKLDITLLDLNARTEALYNALGEERSVYLHAIYNANKGNKVDNTHLNNYGSNVVADLVAEEICKSNLNLRKFIAPATLLNEVVK